MFQIHANILIVVLFEGKDRKKNTVQEKWKWLYKQFLKAK
jgi:hypothetical protein